MTIHTFEVSTTLTSEKYYKLQNELKSKDKNMWQSLKGGMAYWGLSSRGILIYFSIIKKNGFYSYKLKYRISARRVIENDNCVGLFDTKDYPTLNKTVNKILKNKCDLLPKLNKCTLSRIDFCINAELESQEQVKAYIKMAKRANIPSSLKLKTSYDKKSKRQKAPKDDFTLYSEDYIEISVYNKYRQMLTNKVFADSETERSKNIVRIEIRCLSGKLKELKKKYSADTLKDFMENSDKIGTYLFEYYLGKIFGTGTIYTLKDANARIDMSGFRNKDIHNLKEFVGEANGARSVHRAAEVFEEFYTKDGIKRLFRMMDTIGTNCITVPPSDAKLFEDGCILSPIEIFGEYICGD